jgi:APA family basic amino acid/polyamine antiporter
MNGLMLGCCRGIYAIAARKQGPAVEVLEQVDAKTNMPTNSSIVGLLLCAFWMAQWEFGLIQGKLPAIIAWENDELPIITLYGMYIPIFVIFMIREKGLHPVKRFVLPGLASACCAFMVYCAFAGYGIQAVYYLIVSCIVLAIGMLFYRNAEGKTVLSSLIGKIKK